jgi:hypothetical protein
MILSIEESRTRNGDKETRREETGKRRSLYTLYPVSYNLRPATCNPTLFKEEGNSYDNRSTDHTRA